MTTLAHFLLTVAIGGINVMWTVFRIESIISGVAVAIDVDEVTESLIFRSATKQRSLCYTAYLYGWFGEYNVERVFGSGWQWS